MAEPSALTLKFKIFKKVQLIALNGFYKETSMRWRNSSHMMHLSAALLLPSDRSGLAVVLVTSVYAPLKFVLPLPIATDLSKNRLENR